MAGTLWHGLFENDEFRRSFLREIAVATGRRFEPAPHTCYADVRHRQFEALADLVADNIDESTLWQMIDRRSPSPPTLTLSTIDSSRPRHH